MRETDEHPRQHGTPALVVGARVSGLEPQLICGSERLDEVEHRMPEARLNARALLVIRRVLLRQLRNDRLEARVDLEQRLDLSGPDFATPAGKLSYKIQRLL